MKRKVQTPVPSHPSFHLSRFSFMIPASSSPNPSRRGCDHSPGEYPHGHRDIRHCWLNQLSPIAISSSNSTYVKPLMRENSCAIVPPFSTAVSFALGPSAAESRGKMMLSLLLCKLLSRRVLLEHDLSVLATGLHRWKILWCSNSPCREPS